MLPNIMDMSDDEFAEALDRGELNTAADASPEPETPAGEPASEPVIENNAEAETPTPTPTVEGGTEPEGNGGEGSDAEPKPDVAASEGAAGAEAAVVEAEGDKTEAVTPVPEGEVLTAEQKAAAFDTLVGTIKANGKEVKIRNADEARNLMQLGLNYGRLTQKIAPHRKVVAMLEDADLINNLEDLSFLIDLKKGDKAAIHKLLRDHKVDTFDMDINADPNYTGGRNVVTDHEANFRAALDDVKSLEGGQELIDAIYTAWDAPSRQMVWENPEVMRSLHENKQNGVYDLIVQELNHRKTVGTIPLTMPFLQAYTQVGMEMEQRVRSQAVHPGVSQVNPQGSAAPGTPPAGQPSAAPEVVATRTVQPRPQETNGDRAKAAAPASPSVPTNAAAVINPLEMSDAEFAKRFK